ncbi:MAG: murein biosynthesis integral membrane protein MurJ [Holosporales bacterium]|jgi:putative peptidoglycan lipid II flippase|nr:murein biosynthesis integral membrane protein MurJ [Holosporales bacterium]
MMSIKQPLDAVKTSSFVRHFYIVASWTGLSRVSGVIREMLLANIFGVGAFSDIYAFAIKLPSFFRKFFAEGALNVVLVPRLSCLAALNKKEQAIALAQQVLSILMLSVVIFSVLMECIMPGVVAVIAPGFKGKLYLSEDIIYFSRLIFPYIVLISITAMLSSLLNSFNHFAWPAAASFILNIVMILSLVVCKLLGPQISSRTIMHVVCLSTLGGGVLQCVSLWDNGRRNGLTLKLTRPRFDPEIKKIIKATIPGMLGASFTQINIFVDLAFASLLAVGSVSYLNFADRLNQLPLALFGASLGVALLPTLAKSWEAKDKLKAYETQNHAIVFSMALVIPATVGLFVLAEPIVSILYEHGKFSHFDVLQTMAALKAFVIGLPAYVLSKIFLTIFFANKNTKTPVYVAGGCVFLNGILSFILKGPLAHVGIALATAISSIINMILCAIILGRKELFKFPWSDAKQVVKIIVTSMVMGVVIWYAANVLFPIEYEDPPSAHKIPWLFGIVLVGIAVYSIQLYLLKIRSLFKNK